MQSTSIDEKVNVFISSNCGDKYTIAREALRYMLLETGMCQVYMFEEVDARSSDVVSSYMRSLERSDIVVFLIDNKDGIGSGTMKEVKGARELKKKSIFLFCDEYEKESTELQKEIIRMSNGEKFKVVSQFAKLPEIAYESVINDIIDTYLSYCQTKIDVIDTTTNNENIVENVVGDISAILSKEAFKGFHYSKWMLNCEISRLQQYGQKIDTFDRLCSDFLCVILGNKCIEDIDFNAIKKYIKDIHQSGDLQQAIMIRLDAMESYWNGDVGQAISFLEQALAFVQESKQIPCWFINDIAIDLRNVTIIFNTERNILDWNPRGQDIINESKEPIFYPVGDRLSSNYYESIVNHALEAAMESPYTVHIGGCEQELNQIVDIYISALLYGSITHTLLIREKIVTFLQESCLKERDHRVWVVTIKLLLLIGKEKNLTNFVESYGIYTDYISAEDVSEWVKSVSRVSIKYRRFNSSNLLLSTFGAYFDDEEFERFYGNLKTWFNDWTDEQYAIDMVTKGFIRVLENNCQRISQTDILEIVYLSFNKRLKRWYDNWFELLKSISFENVQKSEIEQYVIWLSHCADDIEIAKCRNFPLAIQNLRLQREEAVALDDLVKDKFTNFYMNEYSLNVYNHDSEEIKCHLDRYILDIEERNASQGENGCYSGYAVNPYKTIWNIARDKKFKLYVKEVEKILKVSMETLVLEKQTMDSKFDAWLLITTFCMKYPKTSYVRKVCEKINEKQDLVMQGKKIFLLSAYNDSCLYVAYQMWRIFTNQNDEMDVIATFAHLVQYDVAETITVLDMLHHLFNVAESIGMEVKHSKYILQALLEYTRSENSDVRFHAYLSLIKIMSINEECTSLVLNRLSEAMDGEVYKNKIAILSRLMKRKDKQTQYIISKGKVDNHYWVRDVANRWTH